MSRCSAGPWRDGPFLVGCLSAPEALTARNTLKTAVAHGLPVSVFLGRRKPGSIWLAADTLAALAWQSYLNSLCPGCGHPRHESFDVEADGAYVAHADRCHACTAAAVQQRAWAKADADVGYEGAGGRYFSTERRA